jgi:protein TonB
MRRPSLAVVLALITPAAAQAEPIRLPPVEVRAAHPLVPAQYRSTPGPSYPASAREQGLEGEVVLAVEVRANGRVGDARVKRSSGAPVLDEAALAAVKQWTFVPARRGPRAVDSRVEVPVTFSLRAR